MKRVLLSWSSGKDSAWSLHVLREMPDVEVVGLLTTINQAAQRVAMHAVRRTLLERQAASVGLPVTVLDLPWPCSNEQYETIMAGACKNAIACGMDAVAFGDLFLRDIREYREKQLRGTGLEPLFPLWEIPTDRLAREMLQGGLLARITCVDLKKLAPEFAGREWNAALLVDLPPHTDPCGENGEFHTFCYAAPGFSREIPVVTGEVVTRDGFAFADLTEA
ncbi:MAG: ATP-binding protein [Terriglobales bacterium]